MQDPLAQYPIGSPFIELQSVDSTNNYARKLINGPELPESQAGTLHGTAVFAHEQISGKGRIGKKWMSDKGTNIALSIVIRPGILELTQQFFLSAVTALAVYDLFQKHADDHVKIKWPNDLYWQDRKAGGILIESVITSSGKWDWAIIGIGININQVRFAAELHNPVSLKQITGKEYDPVSLAKELCPMLQAYLLELEQKKFDHILALYNEHLYKKGELVKFRKGNRVFEAKICEVKSNGRLVVTHSVEESFDINEIEWLFK